MDTLPLNVESILDEIDTNHGPWSGIAPSTCIGNVHLRVSRIDDSIDFHTHALGFDLITRYGPSAGFVSTGGYHHHIGFNTWHSAGAPPPPENSVGLNWLTFEH